MYLKELRVLTPKQKRARERMIELEKSMFKAKSIPALEAAYSQACKVWDYNFVIEELFTNRKPDHERIYNDRIAYIQAFCN